MKSTTNVFSKGLTTDLHPMQVANTQLTDALNATFITYNGNELMLLNDMGNTRILDSTTGIIMGLKEGFVPVGMTEYGGVMYIASYNPIKGISELGSIPSPVFNYSYNFNNSVSTPNKKLLTLLTFEQSDPITLSNERFSAGDIFFIDFDITEGNSSIIRYYDQREYVYPSISKSTQTGLMSIHLYADCDDTPQTVDLNIHKQNLDASEQRWYHRWDKDKNSVDSNGERYDNDDNPTNAELLFEQSNVIHYPNFQSGTLNIKTEIEYPHNYKCLENTSTARLEPYYYTDEGNKCVWVVFPGLEYIINGPLWVDKINVLVTSNGSKFDIYTDDGMSVIEDGNIFSAECPITNVPVYYNKIDDATPDKKMYIIGKYYYYDNTIIYENESNNGGLFSIKLEDDITTSLDIKLLFYSNIDYQTAKISVSDGQHVYDRIYKIDEYSSWEEDSTFVKVGELELTYNPTAVYLSGRIEITFPNSIPLLLDADRQISEVTVDFTDWIDGLAAVSNTWDLGTYLGPQKGLETPTLAQLACQGINEGNPAIKRLVEQIPNILEWMNEYKPNLSYKLWILGQSLDVNAWLKNNKTKNLDLFCSRASYGGGTSSDTLYYTLGIIENDDITYPLKLETTLSLDRYNLRDLHVFYNTLGITTMQYKTNIQKSMITISNTITLNGKTDVTLLHAFNLSDEIRTELDDIVSQDAFLTLPPKNDIAGLSDIYPYIFGRHDDSVNLILPTTPYLDGQSINDDEFDINLDASYDNKITITPHITYTSIKDLTYCVPVACWERVDIKTLGLKSPDSAGPFKESINTTNIYNREDALKVELGVEFKVNINEISLQTPDFSIIPYLVFENIIDDELVSYPLKNSNILKKVSIDINNNYYDSENDDEVSTPSWLEEGYFHSFKSGELKVKNINKGKIRIPIRNITEPGWYLVKWDEVNKSWADNSINFPDTDELCARAVFLSPQDTIITIDISSQYVDVYNLGVFKIIDLSLIDKLTDKYPNCNSSLIVKDTSIIGEVALPHCLILFENTTRFKKIKLKDSENNLYSNILYKTLASCPPYCHCLGYYSFNEDIFPSDIKYKKNRLALKKLLIDVAKTYPIKLLKTE